MEKHHFKDRSKESMYNNCVIPGGVAFICEKEAQKYAKTLDDLTYCRIVSNLTSQKEHPRGQKIRGIEIKTGKYGDILDTDDLREVIGRCTYIAKDNEIAVYTPDTEKYIVKENGITLLRNPQELLGKNALYAFLNIDSFSFLVRIGRFLYLNEKDIDAFIDSLKISDITLSGSGISMLCNNEKIKIDKHMFYINGNRNDMPQNDIFHAVCEKCSPVNQTQYDFNKVFSLSLGDFAVKTIG